MNYIAVLRGINVGGKRKILMTDLKTMFLKMGFVNTRTYIQSGNVAFESLNSIKDGKLIEQQIKETFGFDVPVIILNAENLEGEMSKNPFLSEADTAQLHVTFLESQPEETFVQNIDQSAYLPDQFEIVDRFVFLNIEGKYHKSKLTNNFFEKHLKSKATTRNWKTVQKLLEL